MLLLLALVGCAPRSAAPIGTGSVLTDTAGQGETGNPTDTDATDTAPTDTAPTDTDTAVETGDPVDTDTASGDTAADTSAIDTDTDTNDTDTDAVDTGYDPATFDPSTCTGITWGVPSVSLTWTGARSTTTVLVATGCTTNTEITCTSWLFLGATDYADGWGTTAVAGRSYTLYVPSWAPGWYSGPMTGYCDINGDQGDPAVLRVLVDDAP